MDISQGRRVKNISDSCSTRAVNQSINHNLPLFALLKNLLKEQINCNTDKIDSITKPREFSLP